jgi:hypothetical protein
MEHFVAHLMKDKLYAVLLLYGKGRDGAEHYVYLSVHTDQLDAIAALHRERQFWEPTDFGKVLCTGVGVPSNETMMQMETDYGFSHSDYVHIR